MSIEVTADEWRKMRELADERDHYKAECEEWVEAHDKLAVENSRLIKALASLVAALDMEKGGDGKEPARSFNVSFARGTARKLLAQLEEEE